MGFSMRLIRKLEEEVWRSKRKGGCSDFSFDEHMNVKYLPSILP